MYWKKTLILLGMLGFLWSIRAQMPELSWGKPLSHERLDNHFMIGSDGQNHWVYSVEMRVGLTQAQLQRISIKRFSAELNFAGSKSLDLKFQGQERNIVDIILAGDNLWVFSAVAGEKGESSLWVEGFDAYSLQASFAPKAFMKGLFDANEGEVYTYRVSTSPDRSKILLHAFKYQFDKKLLSITGILENQLEVFDARMNDLWSYDLEDDKRYSLTINDQGTVIGPIQGEIPYGELGAVHELGSKNPGILVIKEEGLDVQVYDLTEEDVYKHFNFQVQFVDENLIYATILTDRGGVRVLHLDLELGEIILDKKTNFDDTPDNTYEGVETEDGEVVNIIPKDVILRSDGGMYLCGEISAYAKIVWDDWPTGGIIIEDNNRRRYVGEQSQHYWCGHILVVNISPDGEIIWAKLFRKRQRVSDSGIQFSVHYLSFTPILAENEDLLLIFNDNSKNYTARDREEAIYTYTIANKKSAVTISRVNQAGIEERSIWYDRKEAPLALIAESVVPSENGQFIFLGFGLKEFRLGRMEW